MTQVPRGNRPGGTLPVRIHDLLLSLAGRLDDDALADARQMLASAELDRSLEYVAGCLVAGRVALSKAQHHDIESLFADTYLDPSLIDRLVIMDPVPMGRHQFAVGAVDGRDPERGVAEAIRPVLNVLPDVRTVWCVWRLTPAGPVSGPVPHRVVLVGVGPAGFAPATAYRVEYALRRAGIRVSVEVLVDGNEAGPYHQEAMRCAQQVPFDEPGTPGAQISPVEPARAQPFGAEQPAPPTPSPSPRVIGRPLGPVRTEAPGEHALPPAEPLHGDHALPPPVELPQGDPFPPPVEPPQGAHALPQPVELPRGDALPQPVELRPVAPAEMPPPVQLHPATPEGSMPTPSRGIPAQPNERAIPPGRLPGPVPLPKPAPRAVSNPVTNGVTNVVPNPGSNTLAMAAPTADQTVVAHAVSPGPGEATAVFARDPSFDEPEDPAEQPQSALHIDTPTNSRPSPRRRSGTRPRLLPASRSDNPDNHSAAFGDDVLNTQERNLLRELQDELARREQQDQGGSAGGAWFDQNTSPGFDAMPPGQPPMVNGGPQSHDGRGYPPAT